MEGEIIHEGVVEEIRGRFVRVIVLQNSGCSTCEASVSCHATGLRERRIDVDDAEAASRLVRGDRVQVAASRSVGRKAAWLAFGIPLVLLAGGVGLNATGLSEGVSFLIAIGALAVYYAVLHLMRGHLKGALQFHIK